MIYIMRQVVQAFQVGSSTVMTLPKELGIVPGQKLQIAKVKRGVLVMPRKKSKMTDEKAARIVEKLAGGLNLKKHFTPKEMNRVLDEEYESVLPRR